MKAPFLWHIVFDVDGVLTDGTFTYSVDGKTSKTFGSHDSDALSILREFCEITFVTADRRGFEVSKKRLADMGFDLQLSNSINRLELIKSLLVNRKVLFVADSFTDIDTMKMADISVVPKNAHTKAKQNANLVLKVAGGQGAVSEVCFLIIDALKNRSV